MWLDEPIDVVAKELTAIFPLTALAQLNKISEIFVIVW
jgi:hypothetical protein